ncbi:MAG: hypothetical protein EP330_02180 [Deltaproteobacteria bacterium]|nr:MAG: hypothetical protein EP330_02180 [Deltaproteobacteria bacterium]
MRLVPIALGLALLTACLGGGDSPEVTQPADALLSGNDLPAAHAQYEAIATANPTSVYAATGLAHSLMLKGDYDAAQKALAGVQEAADKAGSGKELRLRRALIALAANDLDSVKQYGAESELPEGLVLAAEVQLVDAAQEEAIGLLNQAVAGSGPASKTAKRYLDDLQSGDQYRAGLAEATALWALGLREDACEQAEEIVKELESEDRDELLILWAGRAVTSGKGGIARSLLDAVEDAGPHVWRVQATSAMIDVADGEFDNAKTTFEALTKLAEEGQIPMSGVLDAKATAAALCPDRDVAREILGETGESASAAAGLLKAGAVKAARDAAPAGGLLSTYLENR